MFLLTAFGIAKGGLSLKHAYYLYVMYLRFQIKIIPLLSEIMRTPLCGTVSLVLAAWCS